MDKKLEKNTKKSAKNMQKTKKIEKKQNCDDLIEALKLKAFGYQTKEIIEEYALDDHENERLIKKKVTKKNVPPDITAVKVLLELQQLENQTDVSKLTNEELDEKIDEIIKKLKENENDNWNWKIKTHFKMWPRPLRKYRYRNC